MSGAFSHATREEKRRALRLLKEQLNGFDNPFVALGFGEGTPTVEQIDTHAWQFKQIAVLCSEDLEEYRSVEQLIDATKAKALKRLTGANIGSQVSWRAAQEVTYGLFFASAPAVGALLGLPALYVSKLLAGVVFKSDSVIFELVLVVLFAAFLTIPLQIVVLRRGPFHQAAAIVGASIPCLYFLLKDSSWLDVLQAQTTQVGMGCLFALSGYLGGLVALLYARNVISSWPLQEIKTRLEPSWTNPRHVRALWTGDDRSTLLTQSKSKRPILPPGELQRKAAVLASFLVFALMVGGFAKSYKAENDLERTTAIKAAEVRGADSRSTEVASLKNNLAEKDKQLEEIPSLKDENKQLTEQLVHGKPDIVLTPTHPIADPLSADDESSPYSESGQSLGKNQVTIKVCSLSGLLPNTDCKTVLKSFNKKKLPKRYCDEKMDHIHAVEEIQERLRKSKLNN